MKGNSAKTLKVIAAIILAVGVIVGVYIATSTANTDHVYDTQNWFNAMINGINKTIGIEIAFISLIPSSVIWGIGELVEISSQIYIETKDTRNKAEDIYYYLNKKQQSNDKSIEISKKDAKDKISELKEIGELKEKGILTDEEFKEQKAKILNY